MCAATLTTLPRPRRALCSAATQRSGLAATATLSMYSPPHCGRAGSG